MHHVILWFKILKISTFQLQRCFNSYHHYHHLDWLDRAPHLCSYLLPPPLHLLTHTPMFRVLSIENEVLITPFLGVIVSAIVVAVADHRLSQSVGFCGNQCYCCGQQRHLNNDSNNNDNDAKPSEGFFLLSNIFLLILTRCNDMS
jgi:hypothetical protein